MHTHTYKRKEEERPPEEYLVLDGQQTEAVNKTKILLLHVCEIVEEYDLDSCSTKRTLCYHSVGKKKLPQHVKLPITVVVKPRYKRTLDPFVNKQTYFCTRIWIEV